MYNYNTVRVIHGVLFYAKYCDIKFDLEKYKYV